MRPDELHEYQGPSALKAIAPIATLAAEPVVSEQISSLGNTLDAYLASKLFDRSEPEASDGQQRHDSTVWAPVPSLPASYRTEALALFGNYAVLGQEGVSSDDALSSNLLEDITGVPRVASNEHLGQICLDSADLHQPRLSQKRRRSLDTVLVNAESPSLP